MACNCTSNQLFRQGCNCGAFTFERSNHIWFNGVIYSIAKTEDEARRLSTSYLRDFEDFDSAWIDGDGNGWGLIPDDLPLPLLITEDQDTEETRLAYEWVEYYGPGFLASI
jgi:hypothetical protein